MQWEQQTVRCPKWKTSGKTCTVPRRKSFSNLRESRGKLEEGRRRNPQVFQVKKSLKCLKTRQVSTAWMGLRHVCKQTVVPRLRNLSFDYICTQSAIFFSSCPRCIDLVSLFTFSVRTKSLDTCVEKISLLIILSSIWAVRNPKSFNLIG